MIAKILLVVQLAIGTVLLLASAGKWRDPMGFARGVADYEILPAWLSVAFGLLLIPVETWLAFSHLTGWWISLSASLGLVMFASFSVAVGINLARGRALPCYCFGDAGSETISVRALGRLSLLLVGEGLLLFSPGQARPRGLVYHQLASLQELGFALFWTALLMITVMWLLALTDLVELLRSHSSFIKSQSQAGGLAHEGGRQ